MTSRKSINNLSALRNPFEREIILEYEKLCQGIEKLNQTIVEMNTTDVITLIDQLRTMEKKVGLVYTLFRASAYSLNNTDNNNNVPGLAYIVLARKISNMQVKSENIIETSTNKDNE
ncbi:10196_t:CDS:2 [Entrophospora sp. SA101]|nr:10196_t:CDS:2 [Entrophospora sp. SA101]